MRGGKLTRLGAAQVALAAVVLAAVVGGVVGGLVGSSRPTTATATTLLALQQDPTVSGNADASLQGASDVSEGFLQTELVYLGSDQFLAQVEDEVGSEVELEASRVTQSNVAQVSVTADTAAAATAGADAAAALYVDRRTTQATERLDAQASTVQSQLDGVLEQLDAAQASTVLPSDAGTTQALQGRYESLLTLSTNLAVARESAGQGVQVVQTAVLDEADGLSPTVVGVVLGALLGALLGAGAAALWRQSSSTVRGESDLAGAEAVLPPRLPHSAPGDLVPTATAATSPLARAAQRQSVQLLAGRDETLTAVVALVGAGPGAGTSTAALQHAAAMAGRGPVVLVCAGDVVPGTGSSPASTLAGVDAGAPGLLDLARSGSVVTADDVARLRQATAVGDLSVLTAGTGTGSPADLEHLVNRGLVAALRATGADVVVDAPSLERSGAAPRLAAQADAVALVAGVGTTSRADVEVGLRALARADGAQPAVLVTEPRTGRRAAPPARPAGRPSAGARPADDAGLGAELLEGRSSSAGGAR